MDRVVIVGGGALGLMHAVSARRRGLDVVHLEREPGPRGATVRNFGLVWVSGRAGGPELDLALRARELWEQLGAEVPAAGFRPHGSLTLAAGEAELALLKEAAARPDAARRGYELLDPAAAREVSPAARRVRRRAAVPPGRDRRAAAGARRHPRPPAGGRRGPRSRLRLAARPRGRRGDALRRPRPHRRLAHYDHLRGRAQQLLGTPLPPARRRWAGVYSQVTTTELYHRSQVAPGVVLVTGPGGRGMTCSPAIAEETFA
jgi:glycine/D-amino acid oxidase-like deaminating enzyme